jgi:peptidylprolyl isomerase
MRMTRKKNKRKSLKEKRRRAALKRQKALEAERSRREKEPKKSKRWSRRKVLGVIFLFLIVLVMGAYVTWQKEGTDDKTSSAANIVLFETNIGDIKIELYDDMPITTGNFKKLVQQGVYDGTIFHRVSGGFVIQGGDPTGTGYGDPSIPTIPDEFTDHNENNRGTIAMANKGPNTGNSQFFINLVDNSHLDTEHPVFGKVIEGMDVVDSIGEVETDENEKPLQDVKIIKAYLIE